MEMGYGEYYCINLCAAYPMDCNKISSLIIGLLDRATGYEASFLCIDTNHFEYEKAIDDEYGRISITKDIEHYFDLYTLAEVYIQLQNGLIIRVLHDYLDGQYYQLSFLVSMNDIEERFSEEDGKKLIRLMEKKCIQLFDPIYAAIGVESDAASLADIFPSPIYEKIYIGKDRFQRIREQIPYSVNDVITITEFQEGCMVEISDTVSVEVREQAKEEIWRLMRG